MPFVLLFALSFLASAVLQWVLRRVWLSLLVPVLGFVLFILYDEFVLPYAGGGASMWPIAIALGAPVALLGAVVGLPAGNWLSGEPRSSLPTDQGPSRPGPRTH